MLLIGALVAWAGLALQFSVSLKLLASHGMDVWQTLSRMLAYFTILTNLVVAADHSIRLVTPDSAAARWLEQSSVGNAIAMYLLTSQLNVSYRNWYRSLSLGEREPAEPVLFC